MNLDTATKEQRYDIERRIAKGFGEIVTVEYTDLEEAGKKDEGEDIFTVGDKKYRRVKKERKYYVGKMTAGTTGGVLSILGVLFLRGVNLKEVTGQNHNLAFLEVLDDEHLSLLIAMALGGSEEQEFVLDNFDLDGWVVDVLTTFFKYNNFFNLVGKFQGTLQNMGITEEQARKAALGSATA